MRVERKGKKSSGKQKPAASLRTDLPAVEELLAAGGTREGDLRELLRARQPAQTERRAREAGAGGQVLAPLPAGSGNHPGRRASEKQPLSRKPKVKVRSRRKQTPAAGEGRGDAGRLPAKAGSKQAVAQPVKLRRAKKINCVWQNVESAARECDGGKGRGGEAGWGGGEGEKNDRSVVLKLYTQLPLPPVAFPCRA